MEDTLKLLSSPLQDLSLGPASPCSCCGGSQAVPAGVSGCPGGEGEASTPVEISSYAVVSNTAYLWLVPPLSH